MRKLLYGNEILSNLVAGTAESVADITIDDLERYHAAYVSPMAADVHFAGDVDEGGARRATAGLRELWKGGPVEAPAIVEEERGRYAGKLCFVDFPGAQQSSIMVSCHAMARRSEGFYPAYIANYRLGDGSHGLLFNELRLKRGYTYGAYSYFGCGNYLNRFVLSTKVQGIKTAESLEVIKELLEGYADGFTDEDMEFTRSSIRKSGFGAYETPEALVGMMSEISQFGLPEDYVARRETLLDGITAQQVREAARRYIDPARMTYLVVGDAATQLERVRGAGLGEPVILDKRGRIVG